jgi:hypothetical protein
MVNSDSTSKRDIFRPFLAWEFPYENEWAKLTMNILITVSFTRKYPIAG